MRFRLPFRTSGPSYDTAKSPYISSADLQTADLDSSNVPEIVERPIGQLMVQAQTLTGRQVERVLAYQRRRGLRFGEAAVALGFAGREDVLRALARQFSYPYAAAEDAGLSQELVMANQPFSQEVEAFRDLRSQLLMSLMLPSGIRRAVAVISANIGDGKSFVAANLAVGFSQLPGRTLLIDADMRTPRLHQVFGFENSHGLSTLLSGRSVADLMHAVPGLPNLHVLPVGIVPPNPLELLEGSRFALLIGEVLGKFDYVLVDTPAAVHGSDALTIAAKVGAAVMVSRRHQTQAQPAQSLMVRLCKAQVAMGGVIMNEH